MAENDCKVIKRVTVSEPGDTWIHWLQSGSCLIALVYWYRLFCAVLIDTLTLRLQPHLILAAPKQDENVIVPSQLLVLLSPSCQRSVLHVTV